MREGYLPTLEESSSPRAVLRQVETKFRQRFPDWQCVNLSRGLRPGRRLGGDDPRRCPAIEAL